MSGILIGAGIVFALSFIVCLFDRDTRNDFFALVSSVLVVPVYVLMMLGLRFVEGRPKITRLHPRSLHYIANTVKARGWVIERPTKAVLVITKTEKPEEEEEES